MLGTVVLFVILGVEVIFMIYCLVTKANQERNRNIIKIGLFTLLTLLAIIGVVQFGFRWYVLFLILCMKALIAIWHLARRKLRKEKNFTKMRVILTGIGNCMLFILAVLPAILFPQFNPVEPTGNLKVNTVSYTLTDMSRTETFADAKENRKVTIQLWYPEGSEGTYPLVVFSHGAFGFRGSNLSTFENLASNGYVVCSIDHTYQSFFSKQTDGNIITVDMEFINNAMSVENDAFDVEKTYELTHEWLELRRGDVNFVLDTLLESAVNSKDEVYQLIDKDRIGVFGHSLGGATSARIGRERTDIDAVIVVDGTMFGEEIDFMNGAAVLTGEPYPVPLLNIYNEEHNLAAKLIGDKYPNVSATVNAIDAREVVIIGSGHLNFTDLPMFSPILAGLLGTGEVDSRYCIETMNQVVLEYFNYYLKDAESINIMEEY